MNIWNEGGGRTQLTLDLIFDPATTPKQFYLEEFSTAPFPSVPGSDPEVPDTPGIPAAPTALPFHPE